MGIEWTCCGSLCCLEKLKELSFTATAPVLANPHGIGSAQHAGSIRQVLGSLPLPCPECREFDCVTSKLHSTIRTCHARLIPGFSRSTAGRTSHCACNAVRTVNFFGRRYLNFASEVPKTDDSSDRRFLGHGPSVTSSARAGNSARSFTTQTAVIDKIVALHASRSGFCGQDRNGVIKEDFDEYG